MAVSSTQIQPGEIRNPNGRRKKANYFQSFKERLAWWVETKTLNQIEVLVNDPRKFGRLPAIDALVARRIYEASKGNGGADLAMILDRMLGKPPQAITGEDGKPLIPITDINEIARRTAFLLSMAEAAPALLVLAAPTIDQVKS